VSMFQVKSEEERMEDGSAEASYAELDLAYD
jgi:hypothetical protein